MTILACSVQPVSPEEAFTASHPARGVFHLGWRVEPCPVGLNIGGEVIFDMRDDRRVMGIEFFARVGGTLLSPRVAKKSRMLRFIVFFYLTPGARSRCRKQGLGCNIKGRTGSVGHLVNPRRQHDIGSAAAVLPMSNAVRSSA